MTRDENVVPLPERRRVPLGRRLRAEFARVSTPAATLWPRSVAGLIAGGWASLMSLVLFLFVVTLAWVLAPMGVGQFADVMRAAGSFWLLANGGALEWQNAPISLPPLLLTFVLLLFMRRAGGWLAEAVDAADVAGVKQSFAFAIAAVVSVQLLVAASISSSTLQVSLFRSAVGAAIVASVGFGWGLGRRLGVELPEAWYIHRVSVQRYFFALGTTALALTIVSGVVHRQAFIDVLRAVAGDATSIMQFLFVCIVFLPTFVLWVMAVLLGPGFSFGVGTQIGLLGVEVGALPPIPLFALIPTNPPAWSWLLLTVPLSAAFWAIRPVPREENGRLHLRSMVELLALGALAGIAASALSSGALGPGRLATTGSHWWQIALASAGWLLLAALLDELIRRVRGLVRT